MITFNPELLQSTEPLIKANWQETDFKLPFEGFTKEAFPQVTFQQLQTQIEAL